MSEKPEKCLRDHSPEKLAAIAIDFLRSRKGFYYWWDNIDTETQNEILEQLAAAFSTWCIHEWLVEPHGMSCRWCGKTLYDGSDDGESVP